MNSKLRAVVEKIAQLEALVEEWDEWFGNFVSFSTKRDLLRKFGSSDEITSAVSQLDDRARECLEISKGVEKEIIALVNLEVEDARLLVTRLKTIMHEVLVEVSEREKEKLEAKSVEELADLAEKVYRGEA